ncbi:hypothetical protein SO802_034023 [Lithocarpus litseifolius]|uniref:Uncharacterized protein n=1 Tax=Lithocarpus litseifolius TaxID=425828 RepID=A0AAW2BGC9_9ROSI
MPKPFPYKDSHRVLWKYDVSLISTQTGKKKVFFNISSGLFGLTRSGCCYSPEKLEKRRKEIGKGVTESSFEGMVLTVLATNQISFANDELPPEGREHTLPMHIMVKCEDMIVSRVLIDNGSALNVSLLSTIERLNVDTSLIRHITMIIRAFDGTLREV